ncbi:MAG: DUF2818 family protein [Neisseriaceae bacterium]|nr:DUF2818 family protein [Neisseriaceae bacterium]
MTASMYILLVVAFIAANLPFVSDKFFFVLPLKKKSAFYHLLELAVFYGLVGGLAYVLEKQGAMSVHAQEWEFYVTTLCLFLVFAFPGFVIRFFWASRKLA